jgi:ribonuclease BN (tRNA processing enzyme)
MEEYHPAEQLEIGPLSARFCEVPHFTATFACELSSAGQRFTFGADCAPSDALVAFARDTDLLMLEATLAEPEPEGEPRGHMTAAEAGALGRRAGARRVVLTHYSDELDAVRLAAEGARGFGGDVELAAERRAFQV